MAATQSHASAIVRSVFKKSGQDQAEFVPDVELTLTAAPAEISIFDGEPTRVWQFTGKLLKGPTNTLEVLPNSYLGPVIRLRRGQKVRINFLNRLSEDSIIHWHGLDLPEVADGHPRMTIGPGRQYTYEFVVANRAGTYWYHPHPHMRTGAQVYRGLAGLLLVQDGEEDALKLPSGDYEHLCVLQDRVFDSRNQLVFHNGGMMEMMSGFLGDVMMVSGEVQPKKDVDAGWHRVRFLNGSNSRFYKLAWSRTADMVVIGGDGGLLEKPLQRKMITLAPGQRADVLINLSRFAAGAEIHLDSEAFDAADAGGMMGMMGRMMGNRSIKPNGAPLRLMTLKISSKKGVDYTVPGRLSTYDESWKLNSSAKVRRVPIYFQRMQWGLGAGAFEMESVANDEIVEAGSTHIWEFANLTNPMGMQAAHPIHMHGRQFRVIRRSGGAGSNSLRAGIHDAGWTDTVLVLPGETVKVQVTFTKNPGLYLYHCHILEHEDMGMMRNFKVVPQPIK